MNMEKGKKQAQVFHFDLYGKRNEKYDFLQNNTLQSVQWQQLKFEDDNYFFVPKDFGLKAEYEKGFKIDELFKMYSSGIETGNEALIHFNFSNNYTKYAYRPFDFRYIEYNRTLKLRRNCYGIMHNYLHENVGLLSPRQAITEKYGIFLTKWINDRNYTGVAAQYGAGLNFPLYLYPETDNLFPDKKRKPNLNETIINEISQRIGVQFTEEKEKTENTFAPIDVFDYIYAVLHSPSYREKYKEFLKIDFPRIPYPENAEQFWKLVALGGTLRRLHLLEGVEPQVGMADYPIAGSNEVEKPEYVDGKVYINDSQFFENVPLVAWNFYIGGYQPAQKWLKDRKGRTLGYDDILHYQRVIRVLEETGEVMREVDEVDG